MARYPRRGVGFSHWRRRQRVARQQEEMERAQTEPSHIVASADGGENIPGAPTGPEVIDVDALPDSGPQTAEGTSDGPGDDPPGHGWVPVTYPRANVVRSPQPPMPPAYPEGLPFDALARLEADLLLTRQVLDRMATLQEEYERHWSGEWWAALDRWTLEWNHGVQVRQYRSAVERGAVTASQRSHLLSRVDK